jgi:hypothetical protein
MNSFKTLAELTHFIKKLPKASQKAELVKLALLGTLS